MPNNAKLTSFGKSYQKKVLGILGTSLIAYWIQNELAGSVSKDSSGRGFNGAYTGVTLGQPGVGDGLTCPSFDGTTSFNNVYSAGLAAAFNGTEGTLAIWVKVSGSGVWTDNALRSFAYLAVDAGNRVAIRKLNSGGNQIQFFYLAGVGQAVITLDVEPLSFFHTAITWSKSADQFKAYYGGTQTGSTQTSLGTWAGTLTSTTCCLGASSTTPSDVHSGFLAHALLCNRALTAAEIAQLATV